MPSLDLQTPAAKSFYREVLRFSETAKPWLPSIVYFTAPDEVADITLVSQRVYGRRDEYLAVMAAARLDSPAQPLKQQRLVLPTEQQLAAIKRRTGFESSAESREDDGTPTWAFLQSN